MKRRFVAFLCLFTSLFLIVNNKALNAQVQNPIQFGISGGVWMPGNFNYDDDPTYIDAETDSSFLLKGFVDAFVNQYAAFGMYANAAPSIGFDDADSTVSMFELGFAFKLRFILSDTFALKPGFGIGYRSYSSEDEVGDDISAMGTNFSLEMQFMPNSNSIKPYIELGFLAQPVGGNDDYSMTFTPIWYVMGGFAF